MGVYGDYDNTNRFYLALGFKEFEVFPLLWDEKNPCQIYVTSLKQEKGFCFPLFEIKDENRRDLKEVIHGWIGKR